MAHRGLPAGGQLKATPGVTGFAWFEFNKETDWRVESSSTSLAAFMAGLKAL
jgi:hypothetical protein